MQGFRLSFSELAVSKLADGTSQHPWHAGFHVRLPKGTIFNYGVMESGALFRGPYF